ncbi:MAG: TlpA family protein disulfide reductase [Muribaculaceae bacterium]|nr:TlpA family protein disulfide reductase [Muribaculaceae bacterium]
MMKSSLAIAALLSLAPTIASADITVKLPTGAPADLNVSHALIERMINARSEAELNVQSATVPVNGGTAVITIDPAGPSRYSIDIAEGVSADLYAAPGEDITVDITSLQPLTYTVSGTPLMEGMTVLDRQAGPIEQEASQLMRSEQPDMQRLNELQQQYNSIMLDFVKANTDSPAAVFAMLNLSGEDMLEADAMLGPDARASILYPIASAQLTAVRQAVEKQHRQEALASGTVDAPAFTLLDTKGQKVSLSDFRGKWVILDFWGSWCVWCVRGFPHLKETYEQLKPELEVIGIDCGDTEEAWKAAVERFELPWVNVYKPETDQLTEQYSVQGFPTKVIINPEGKIVNITTGEDPAFYERLHELMKR